MSMSCRRKPPRNFPKGNLQAAGWKELLERIREEAKAEDKGMAARLERAARSVAILRGLGYAGAYIGGIDNAERIQWIIKRSEEAASQWKNSPRRFPTGRR